MTKHLLLTGLLVSTPVLANMMEGPFDKQGLSGELSLMAAYTGGTSNFNTDHKTKTGALNSEGKSDSEFLFAPIGQVRYTFGNQQVFLGMAQEDIVEGVFALEAGYAFELSGGTALSISYLPTIGEGETWEDPYLTNTARKKTDVTGNAYRLQVMNIMDIGIDADFAYYDKEVDKENSGNGNKLLRRDGNGYRFKVSAGLPLSQSTFVMPSVVYHSYSADGKAMSFDEIGFGATVMQMLGNSTISLNGNYSKADFDGTNPVFNKKQKDSSYSVNLAYEYMGLMGWQNTSFNLMAGYENTDSNIAFYDENEYMLGMGVRFTF